jgi:hypothetical protein
MSKQPEITDLEFSINIDDLLGPLGYPDRDKVQPEMMDRIISATDRCRHAMAGRAIFSCMELRRIDGRDVVEIDGKTIADKTLADSLDCASAVAVAVCTVGPEIDKIIDDNFNGGDYLQGMIADVAGNRAVEDVAHRCSRLICAEARKMNLSTSRQISPGYGTWDTSGQRPVFELLDPSPIGVTLNDYCMMEPKKSVSFVVPLVEGDQPMDERPPCHGCDFKNCSYRRK